jgi:hypothetical protein
MEAIGKSGGWIKDHHAYSNKMATISFEIPIENVVLLIDGYRGTHLLTKPFGLRELEKIVIKALTAAVPY